MSFYDMNLGAWGMSECIDKLSMTLFVCMLRQAQHDFYFRFSMTLRLALSAKYFLNRSINLNTFIYKP